MLALLPLLLLVALDAQAPRTQMPAAPPPRDQFFTSTMKPEEIRDKQAVLETTEGIIVLDLLADAAPTHVAHFITEARAGAYDGTVFHRVIAMGIIQGGDPLSKDPAQAAKYGTGGLGKLRFEPNAEKHTRGAVAAVQVPGNRDSAGNQFFIVVTDQPALDGQYTVFARVVEGINVAQTISTTPAANSIPAARIEIRKVTIRDKPAPEPEPFVSASVEELSSYHAVLMTTLGDITIELFPDRAPNHVRQFLRLAQSGVYDGTSFHRVVKGFVAQTGHLPTRREPLNERQQSYVHMLQPEFNPTPHERGTVSMARLDDPASASSSFFIVLGRTPALDNQYTVFGRVTAGMEVLDKIENAPLNGEAPIERIDLTGVRLVRQ
jgi:peptidyl-prolyl cis-trans isomerase B (cyclophilin B)